MQLGRVVGHAIATVKHVSFTGQRLALVQPLTTDGGADGEPLLMLDPVGARLGSIVLACNDGAGARELVKERTSPTRWFIMGLRDE